MRGVRSSSCNGCVRFLPIAAIAVPRTLLPMNGNRDLPKGERGAKATPSGEPGLDEHGRPLDHAEASQQVIEPNKNPRLAPRALFSSRNRTYLMTFILACRSVGRMTGMIGASATSLTQRASPSLK